MHIFPEIFITGKLPENWTQKSLVADALCGWACCMGGAKPPEKFGEGMVLIGSKLGISATPDNISKFADKIMDKP